MRGVNLLQTLEFVLSHINETSSKALKREVIKAVSRSMHRESGRKTIIEVFSDLSSLSRILDWRAILKGTLAIQGGAYVGAKNTEEGRVAAFRG